MSVQEFGNKKKFFFWLSFQIRTFVILHAGHKSPIPFSKNHLFDFPYGARGEVRRARTNADGGGFGGPNLKWAWLRSNATSICVAVSLPHMLTRLSSSPSLTSVRYRFRVVGYLELWHRAINKRTL